LLEEEEDIYPGINCCAVCGSDETLINCDSCGRVCWCGKTCQLADSQTHQLVCSYLKEIDDLDISYNAESSSNIEKDIVTSCINEVLRKLESSVIGKRPQNWTSLFLANSVTDERYHRYVSAILSYPLSAGWCFENIPILKKFYNCLRGSKKKKNEEEDGDEEVSTSSKCYVDLLILGASAAECAVTAEMWAHSIIVTRNSSSSSTSSTSSSSSAIGLRITFVGPEVPQELHLKSKLSHILNRHVCLRYYQGELVNLISEGENAFEEPEACSVCGGGGGGDEGGSRVKKMKVTHTQLDASNFNKQAVNTSRNNVLHVDVLFGFNMGLTVEEYPWDSSAKAIVQSFTKKPFVMLTNTEMEMKLDKECFEDVHGLKLKKVIYLFICLFVLIKGFSTTLYM
jgi:hypothetical protein